MINYVEVSLYNTLIGYTDYFVISFLHSSNQSDIYNYLMAFTQYTYLFEKADDQDWRSPMQQ